jgi:hypothetical protein
MIKLNIIRYAKFIFFSIVFFWSVQIGGVVNLPFYILMLLPLVFILSQRAVVITAVSFVFAVLYQTMSFLLYDIEVESITKTILGTAILFFCVLTIRELLKSILIRSSLSAVFLYVYRGIAFLILASITVQIVLWQAGVYPVEYWNYFLPLPRFSSIFAEPSHLAIAISPYYFFTLIDRVSSTKKYDWICCGLIFILCPSSTLILFVAFVLLIKRVTNSKNKIYVISGIAFVLSLMFFALDYLPDLQSRINDFTSVVSGAEVVNTQMNPSTLLFLKGLQTAHITIKEYQMGVGLLNMGFASSGTDVSALNYFYEFENSDDGTSLLFKIISEAGVLGLLFIVYSVWRFYLFLKGGGEDFYLACILSSLLASFLRGTSYYDGVVIIAISIVFLPKNIVGREYGRNV